MEQRDKHEASAVGFEDGEREITGGGIVVLLVATLIAIPIWLMFWLSIK